MLRYVMLCYELGHQATDRNAEGEAVTNRTGEKIAHQLHWLPLASPAADHIQLWHTKFGARPLRFIYRTRLQAAARILRSFTILLLDKPFMRTDFSSVLSGFQHW